jgi:hypothetical protein
MLRIRAEWKGKCSRHPGYNPEKDPRGLGIKGNCEECLALFSRCKTVKEGVNNTGGVMIRVTKATP